MAKQYHYLDENDQPLGPYTLAQLQARAARGSIDEDTLVAEEGGSSWVRWADLAPRTTAGPARATALPRVAMDMSADSPDEFGYDDWLSGVNRGFDAMLSRVYHSFPDWQDDPRIHFRRHLHRLSQVGQVAMLVASLFAMLIFVVLAIRLNSTAFFVAGAAVLPGAFVLQFILGLFSMANLRLTFGAPIHLASGMLPKILVVLGTLGMLVMVPYGLWVAADTFKLSVPAGIVFLVFWVVGVLYAAYGPWIAARSESLLGVSIQPDKPQDAADYFMNLIRFYGRYCLAQVPVVSALYGIAITLIFMVGMVMVLGVGQGGGGGGMELFFLATFVGSIVPVVVIVLLLPVIAHVIYLLAVSLAEFGSGFFRLVENTDKLARTRDDTATKP